MKNKFIYFLTLLIITICSCTPNNKTEESSIELTASYENVLSEQVPSLLKEYNVPCVGIGIIEDGEIKYTKVFGEHQLEKKAPDNTIFNIASITKAIVATTTLKLINEGSWSLDEPLYNYWVDPDIKRDELHKKITTRHILSHTAGFKNWRTGELTIDTEPGTNYFYSGEGFEYLRKSLENKFSKPLNEIIDSVLFKPLELKDATMIWHKDIDESKFAYWYDVSGQHYEYMDYKFHNPNAADDIMITLDDFMKFGVHVLQKANLSERLFNEMVTPQVRIHDNANQGLGWEIIDSLPGNEYFICHDGEDPGVNTTIILFPNSQKGIIILTNGDNGRIVSNKIIRSTFSIGEVMVNKMYWGRTIPQIVNVSDSVLNDISGYYKIDEGGSFTFAKKDKALRAEGGWGIPQFDFYPQSATKYFTFDRDLVFEFLRDKNNEVDSFKLYWHEKLIRSGKKENSKR